MNQDSLTVRDRIEILLREYDALYGLLRFRLEAMDRRLPLVGGGFLFLLGSLSSLPSPVRLTFLLMLPAAIGWLMATTVGHARAKEDHLRRIDEIEREVNQMGGAELLVFQSQHPNRRQPIAGRTGSGTVLALMTMCLAMLAACWYLFQLQAAATLATTAYGAYLGLIAIVIVMLRFGLANYDYQRCREDRNS